MRGQAHRPTDLPTASQGVRGQRVRGQGEPRLPAAARGGSEQESQWGPSRRPMPASQQPRGGPGGEGAGGFLPPQPLPSLRRQTAPQRRPPARSRPLGAGAGRYPHFTGTESEFWSCAYWQGEVWLWGLGLHRLSSWWPRQAPRSGLPLRERPAAPAPSPHSASHCAERTQNRDIRGETWRWPMNGRPPGVSGGRRPDPARPARLSQRRARLLPRCGKRGNSLCLCLSLLITSLCSSSKEG